jgi:3-oxoacyl-[acyl-carrier protein] reductase
VLRKLVNTDTRRVVLVTGGGGGLGRALCSAFAGAGYDVAINYAHSHDDALKTAEVVRSADRQAHTVQADVSDDRAVRAMLDEVVATFGGLDVLINNAATTRYVPLKDLDSITEDDWNESLGVNLKGAFYCARAAAASLRARHGAIVNIATTSAFIPAGSSIPYMTSKAALVMLTRTLAKALAPEVRVNAVAPGFMETPWIERYPPEVKAHIAAGGAPPAIDVGDVSRSILMLAEARSVNGQTLIVDGGQLMR